MCQYFLQQIQADVISFSTGNFVDPRILLQKNAGISQSSLGKVAATTNTSFLEMDLTLSQPKTNPGHNPSSAGNGGSSSGPYIVGGRDRAVQVIGSSPREMRHVPLRNYGTSYEAEFQRQQWIQLYYSVYSLAWQHCREKVPITYLPYCKGILSAYPLVMQGLHWGDRPDTICMRYDFCAQSSYLANQPHTASTLSNPIQSN